MAYVFHNWSVYQDARTLRKKLNVTIKGFPKEENFALCDQIRRAIISVILQIAEGANRKTQKDKAVFINRALTSLDEIVACLDCAVDSNYITQAEYNEYLEMIENISKQLRGLEKHLSSNSSTN